jgi:hypothetical protein
MFLHSCYGFFNLRRFEQYPNFGWINGHSVAAFEAEGCFLVFPCVPQRTASRTHEDKVQLI